MAEGSEQTSEQYIDRVREELADGEVLDIERIPSTEFYVLFSFDLVNSTFYKTLNQAQWPLVITKFYEYVQDGLEKRIPYIRLWKYVGDELLLIKRVRCLEDIRDCVPKAYSVLKNTIERIHFQFRDTKTILSIKATVWCAKVHVIPPTDLNALDRKPSEIDYRNIVVPSGSSGQEQIDFLGPDIDIGFRISRHVTRERLVISADLAYLLYRDRSDNDIENNLRIVSYEQLKGVWGNRLYPIIWYENDWDTMGSSLLYDEHFQDDIIRKIKESGSGDPLKALVKIYQDLDRLDEAMGLWGFVRSLNVDDQLDEVPMRIAGPNVEVHCVAVCFRENGNVLIAQRQPDKKRFPDTWEFGCGQLSSFENFEDCLKRNYLHDFNAELSFRGYARPIKTYTIVDEDDQREIPGIIFIADISNPTVVVARKHTKFEWIDPKNPQLLTVSKCVPGFEETLQLAVEAWEAQRKVSKMDGTSTEQDKRQEQARLEPVSRSDV